MYKEWWSRLEGCILWSCLQGIFLLSETLPCHFSSLCLSSLCALPPCPVAAFSDVILCLPLTQQWMYLHLLRHQLCLQSLASSFPCFSVSTGFAIVCDSFTHTLQLVFKVIPLSPYFLFSRLLSIFQNLLLFLHPSNHPCKHPSFPHASFLPCIFPFFTFLDAVVPETSHNFWSWLEVMLLQYREALPSASQFWAHFDPSQCCRAASSSCFFFAVAIWKWQMVLIRKLI